ncbi:NrsF family protein [Enterobacter ludwigii]
MDSHEALIEKLSRSAAPVKRAPPIRWRVASWVLLALPAGALASLLLQRTATDWSQPGAAWAMAQMGLAFILGWLAITAAFTLSIAGRRPLKMRWLLALATVWLGSVLVNIGHPPLSTNSLHDTHCYTFMVTVSVPMVALVIGYLRRTRTLNPLRSLALSGTGVAAMALTLLTFCHPVHLHAEDFLMHLAAIATIVGATVALGWRWVSAY